MGGQVGSPTHKSKWSASPGMLTFFDASKPLRPMYVRHSNTRLGNLLAIMPCS